MLSSLLNELRMTHYVHVWRQLDEMLVNVICLKSTDMLALISKQLPFVDVLRIESSDYK